MKHAAAAWQRAQRILCVRLDNLGDVLMTTPALQALRAARPGRWLTLLCSPSGMAAASLLPDVDAAIAWRAPWMKHEPVSPFADDLALCERLRAEAFDAAVIFTVCSQSALPAALFCHLAGIPLRLAHSRENPYGLLTDWVPESDRVPENDRVSENDRVPRSDRVSQNHGEPRSEPHPRIRHEVQRQLDLVAQVGAAGAAAGDTRLRLRVPDAARRTVRERLASLAPLVSGGPPAGSSGEGPLVVLHPGATAPSRCYPPAQFAQVARHLAERLHARVLVTGSPAEQPLAAVVCAGAPPAVQDLAGRLSLAELAALIEAADLLVSNNSGPVHMAAALGTPVVDLYALTNPQHTPWQVPSRVLFHDVPCRWCQRSVCPQGHHDCLRRVSPDAVVAAAGELIGEAAVRTTQDLIPVSIAKPLAALRQQAHDETCLLPGGAVHRTGDPPGPVRPAGRSMTEPL